MADKEQCVGECSTFLSQTAREMEKVMCKLKWKKENLMEKVRKDVFSYAFISLLNFLFILLFWLVKIVQRENYDFIVCFLSHL